MADIIKEIEQIKKAVYGEEVRDSIINALKSVNLETENATSKVSEKEPSANKITNFDTTLTDKDKFPTAMAVISYIDGQNFIKKGTGAVDGSYIKNKSIAEEKLTAELLALINGKANNSDLQAVSDNLDLVSATAKSNKNAIAQKANNSDLQTVSANVASNTSAIAQKANATDLQTVSSQVTANTKALGNVYTKSETKSRFAQGISAIYDSSGNIVKATDLSTLSGGALAGDTTITTAFVSNNVTQVQSGCFSGCTNLKTVYIDNIQGKITVQSGAIPSTATVIYTDEFNGVTANAKAILALRSSIGDINTALTELSALADSYIIDTTAATSEEVQ